MDLKTFADAISTSGRYFGTVDGPIFLDEVNCTGAEENILECLSVDAGVHDCSHFQDVGVVCTGQMHTCTSKTMHSFPTAMH